MLQSMTGYGKAQCETGNRKVTIEIKALNSKTLDLSVRIPLIYREKEFEVRNEISRHLVRGKVDLSIFIETLSVENQTTINKEIVKGYIAQIKTLAEELNLSYAEGLIPAVLKLPDSLKSELNHLDETEWEVINCCFKSALELCVNYRQNEGSVTEEDITRHIYRIDDLLQQVDLYEKGRIDRIRQRLDANLNDFLEAEHIDMNRFEQEMIFFLEKLDISEEKVRLKSNLNYFIEAINSDDPVGKKLGFIAQEIGREINTLGSKANDSDIQKIVIQMKDSLEKIKEQINNIL